MFQISTSVKDIFELNFILPNLNIYCSVFLCPLFLIALNPSCGKSVSQDLVIDHMNAHYKKLLNAKCRYFCVINLYKVNNIICP